MHLIFLYILFQAFDVGVDAVKLFRNLDALRTVWHTLSAPYAMVCLPQFWDRPVVAHKEGLPRLYIIFIAGIGVRHIPFVDTFIIMDKDSRNVNAVGTRHAVFAVVACHRRILYHDTRSVVEKFKFVIGERFQRTE